MVSATDRFEIPERVHEAFAGRTSLNMGELARALECNIKTIGKHMDAGNLAYIEAGVGTVRPRRKSTLAQVCAFLLKQSRQQTPWQPTPPNRKSGAAKTAGSSSRRTRKSTTGADSTRVEILADRRAKLAALAHAK